MRTEHPGRRTLSSGLITLALAAGIAFGQNERPPLTREQFAGMLRQLIQESIPVVEYVAQRRFKSPPSVVIGETGRATQSLSEDLFLQLKVKFSEVDAESMRKYSDVAAAQMIKTLLGKYGLNDRTLYVLPESLLGIRSGASVEPSSLPELLRLVLIHELAHALHDQYIPLAQQLVNSGVNPNRSVAFNTVLEGFATFVEQRAARFLSSAEDAQELLRLRLVTDARIPQSVRYRANLSTESYLTGARYFHEVHRSGGIEAVWAALRNPPTDSSVISQIAARGSEAHPSDGGRDVKDALGELHRAFVQRAYTGTVEDFRGVELSAFLGSAERASALLASDRGFAGSARLRLHASEKQSAADIFLVSLASTEAAGGFEAGLLKGLSKGRTIPGSSGEHELRVAERHLQFGGSGVTIADLFISDGKTHAKVGTSYFVRTGNTLAVGHFANPSFSESELIALLQSASVRCNLILASAPAAATSAAAAPVDRGKGMTLKDLGTMLSMGFSEQDILGELSRKPLIEPIDENVKKQLAARGASPAVIAAAARPTAQAQGAAGVQQVPPPPMPRGLQINITDLDLQSLARP